MATIINNVALTVGIIESSPVVNPTDIRFHIKVSGVTDTTKEIRIVPKIKDGAAFVPIEDGNGYAIQWKVKGNKEFSRNLLFINSALLHVFVYNSVGLVGNITIDTYVAE